MSYPRDLDEIPAHELERELARRAESRREGLCDYCHREPSTPPCKFPDRHTASMFRGFSAARGGAPAPPSAEWSRTQAQLEELIELREACAQAAATLNNAGAPFGDGTLTLAQRIAGLVKLLESGAGGAPVRTIARQLTEVYDSVVTHKGDAPE